MKILNIFLQNLLLYTYYFPFILIMEYFNVYKPILFVIPFVFWSILALHFNFEPTAIIYSTISNIVIFFICRENSLNLVIVQAIIVFLTALTVGIIRTLIDKGIIKPIDKEEEEFEEFLNYLEEKTGTSKEQLLKELQEMSKILEKGDDEDEK